MIITRRSLIAASGIAMLAGNSSAHSQVELEERVIVTPAHTGFFTQIDSAKMEPLRADPALLLWDKPKQLLGKTFTITARQIDFWTSSSGFMIPPTQYSYESVMHLKLAGRDFFMAINDNLRPYRNFQDVRIEGYYGGLMAIEMHAELYYQAGHRIPDVRLVPLVLATSVEGF